MVPAAMHHYLENCFHNSHRKHIFIKLYSSQSPVAHSCLHRLHTKTISLSHTKQLSGWLSVKRPSSFKADIFCSTILHISWRKTEEGLARLDSKCLSLCRVAQTHVTRALSDRADERCSFLRPCTAHHVLSETRFPILFRFPSLIKRSINRNIQSSKK